MSEARIGRLEARLTRVEHAIIRIEARLTTKPELACKPSQHWRLRAAMAAAFTAAIPAGTVSALLLMHLPHH